VGTPLLKKNKDANDVRDSTEWEFYRKKHGLSKSTKIFICRGYHQFKQALIDRGWHENTEFYS
jgi:hypothetical protein